MYLDTHVVHWLYFESKEMFSEKAKNLIDQGNLLISPIVALEVHYLLESGKITVPVQTILTNLEQTVGLKICHKSFYEVIYLSLKYHWTRDPFDRIITAHAALENDILLTRDTTIRKHYKHAAW